MKTNIILDAGGAFLLVVPVFLILFMAIAVFMEAGILMLFGYQQYKVAVRHALLANVVSLVVGILMYQLVDNFPFMLLFAAYYVVTFLVEFGMLASLNKELPIAKLLLASLTMNVASYVLLALILFLLRFL